MGVRLSGLISGMDTETLVSELVSAYEYKKEQVEKEQTILEWTEDAWTDLNTDVYSFYADDLSNMRYQSTYLSQKETSVSDSTKATITASSSVANGTQTLSISSVAKASYLTGTEISDTYSTSSTLVGDLGLTAGDMNLVDSDGNTIGTITISDTTTIANFITQLKSAGFNASFDTSYNRFFISSEDTGEETNFTFDASDTTVLANLELLGLATTEDYTDLGQTAPTSVASYSGGTDCTFTLNGAEFTTSTNSNTINGLTINALGVTDGDITISTSTDVDGIYDTIKSYLSGYNSLINNMTELYSADSAGDYEPLTDDEKEAMTDDQIEEWETLIKDSLLRRDTTLSSIMSALTSAMAATYEIDSDGDGVTETYSLSSFGIATAGYFNADENEENAYHIDGDEDDELTSDESDKLRAAIEDNPELVAQFFSAVSTAVYEKLTDKMSSTTLSSAYTVYNDKQLDDDIEEKQDEVDDWEDKIEYWEDYWYDKFTAMEVALAELQSQQSALSSLLSG